MTPQLAFEVLSGQTESVADSSQPAALPPADAESSPRFLDRLFGSLRRRAPSEPDALAAERARLGELEQSLLDSRAEVERLGAALDGEVRRRAQSEAELRRISEIADTAQLAKAEFAAALHHELAVPLAGLQDAANLLLASRIDAGQRDLIRALAESGEDMLKVLGDGREFSRSPFGTQQLAAVDFNLSRELECALDHHAATAAHRGLELILDVDPKVPAWVRGDPDRLRQVVLQLVGNAIKFTVRGDVTLHVRLDRPTLGRPRLRFEVRDTGLGLTESVRARLFQPDQSDDASRPRRRLGGGLGLAICQRLIGQLGGEMGAESVAGAGSTFWFVVEFDPARTFEPGAYDALTCLDGHRVLVVDDNAASHQHLGRLCADWYLRCSVADSAGAALALLHHGARTRQPFDLVLLDHVMPGADGLDLAGAILADPDIPRPKIVLLTSRAAPLGRGEAAAHGIAACESKPIFAQSLRATLGRVLAGAPGYAHESLAGGADFAGPGEVAGA